MIAALQSSRTRREAAEKLKTTPYALDSACQRYGLSALELLNRPAPTIPPRFSNPVQAAQPAADVPAPEVPAWQGYKPREGWSGPERTPAATASTDEVKRILVVPDTHVPYHDRKAWSVALSITREWKPHRVILIGDFMDTESVSRHPKTQPDVIRLSEEYYETNLRLDEIQNAAPDASWLYVEGNHENRVAKWCNEFGTMDGMLNLPEALYLRPRDEGYHRSSSVLRGMEWIPLSRQPYVIDGVAYLHGVYENQHHAHFHASQLAPTTGAPEVVYGHMHTLQSATSGTIPGRPGYRATCCGFLGDSSLPVFRSYVKGQPKPWDVGLLLQEVSGGLVTNLPIRIIGGRALFGGKVRAA